MYSAIVMAGFTPGVQDELLRYTQVGKKALIRIGGKEMVRYVIEALVGSGCVKDLIIVGLNPEDLPDLRVNVPIRYIPNQGDRMANMLAGLKAVSSADRALLCSADIPLLTSDAVRDFVARCEAADADVCYSVVERSVMESRFPNSGRSFRALRDGHFAGGDLAWINPAAVMRNQDYLQSLLNARKSAVKMARTIGFGTLARFLLRRLTIEYAERRACEVFRCQCKAILSPFPEIGMDVDKIYQYHIVCAELEDRCA